MHMQGHILNTLNSSRLLFMGEVTLLDTVGDSSDFLRNTQNLKKIFLMVLTNQLIYLVNVKNLRKIFQIISASQKFRTLQKTKRQSCGMNKRYETPCSSRALAIDYRKSYLPLMRQMDITLCH